MPVPRLAEILGQPEAVEFLTGVAARGRYANAYLLHGPAGVGKGTAALAFARAILCERATGAAPRASAQAGVFGDAGPPPPEPNPTPGDACNACGACGRSAALQHPDLKFLFPASGEEKKLEETMIETIEAWRADPWFVFTYDKAASIRISITRDLLRDLAFKPYEAERRVVVVRDADRMREDQYSAMLKSIEEPAAATVWVLTTSRPTRLPATIRSRCQRVRFRPLAEAQIGDVLRSRVGVDAASARMLSALAAGSLGRALVLRDTDFLKDRDKALALLASARSGNAAGLWTAVQAINSFGRTGREALRRLIEFQILWQRDLLRARYGGETESFVHADRKADILRAAGAVDATEIRRRLMILEEALRSIDGNITVDTTLFSAESRLADPSLSRTEWPAHPSARWNY